MKISPTLGINTAAHRNNTAVTGRVGKVTSSNIQWVKNQCDSKTCKIQNMILHIYLCSRIAKRDAVANLLTHIYLHLWCSAGQTNPSLCFLDSKCLTSEREMTGKYHLRLSAALSATVSEVTLRALFCRHRVQTSLQLPPFIYTSL